MKTAFLARLQAWLLLFILFAIPLSLKYITKEPFAISYLNLLSVAFIGLGLLNLLFGQVKLAPIRHKPFLVLIAVLLLSMAWALLFTHPLRNGIGLWTSRLTQPLLVGFFAYQLIANGFIKIEQCVKAMFWSLVSLIIIGGLQYIGLLEYRDPGRITATYFYPNTFARYVEILLIVTLPWILFGLKKHHIWYLGLWLVGVLLLLSSKSYNGTASFGLALIAMFAMLPKEYGQLKRVVISGLVIVGALVLLNAPRLPKYQVSITDSRLTRLEFWNVATGVIKDNFWTGIGIKTWEKEYPQLVEKYYIQKYKQLPLNWGSVQPHNVFLDSFVKAGLPGFFAILALLLWPILEGKSFIQSYYAKNRQWWYGASMAGYGVAMLLFGLIDDPIWSDDTMPLMFILLFMLAWFTRPKSKEA